MLIIFYIKNPMDNIYYVTMDGDEPSTYYYLN